MMAVWIKTSSTNPEVATENITRVEFTYTTASPKNLDSIMINSLKGGSVSYSIWSNDGRLKDMKPDDRVEVDGSNLRVKHISSKPSPKDKLTKLYVIGLG